MDLLPAQTSKIAKKHRFRSLKMLTVDMDEALGEQPYGVEYGKLDNGLCYYVRCNSKPRMRAALVLAVKAGSVLEEEDERGVAHIVEHLAFSATKKYTNHDIVKFLESIGAEFGPCQNAGTTADNTIYELFVPIDKPGVLSQAISILAEFSSEIRVSEDDLEKERGAVMEEFRGHCNFSGRLQSAYWALTLKGSKYAERLPIGLENVIKTVSAGTVKQFFRKWYDLNNMAVIAVGDFSDTQNVVELIKDHFGNIKSSCQPPFVPIYPIPSHEEPCFSCLVDSEATMSAVIICYKMPVYELKTVRDYRGFLVECLFLCALNQRFFKVSCGKDRPYFSCSADLDTVVLPLKAFSISSSCTEKGTIKALESMLTEVARIQLHGFSEQEISIVKALLMSEIESAYLERDKMESTTLKNEYLQHFLQNALAVGIEYEAQLQKTLLPHISVSEISEYSTKLTTACSCVIKIVEPHASATIDDLKDVVMKINHLKKKRDIAPWDEEFIPDEIVSTMPNPGSILQQLEYPNIGATEIFLSNGMRVCYKCTDFFKDQVTFTGFSYGALSELSEIDYNSCLLGPAIAGEAGVFGYRPSVLVDMLAGKRAIVGKDFGPYMRTFHGDCSPSDLETALQLVYQLFTTKVIPSEEDVKIVMQMQEEAICARERDPYTAFSDRVTELNYGNSYYFAPYTLNDLQKVDSQKACEYFNNSFRDPSNFTVVVVGNINPSIALPLIQQYLGGIPQPPQPIMDFNRDDLKSLLFTFSKSIVREVVYSPMAEAQCSVQLSFPVELKNGTMVEEMHFVGFLSKLLEMKILQVLRFKHGQIYSAEVLVYLGGDKPSKTTLVHGDISITFSCDPEVSSKLVDLTLDEILHIQEEGPTDEDVSAVLEIEQRTYEIGLQENYSWLERILRSYHSNVYSGDIGTSFEIQNEGRLKVRDSLTPSTAQLALQRILPFPCTKQYTAVILMPESFRSKKLKSFVEFHPSTNRRDANVSFNL